MVERGKFLSLSMVGMYCRRTEEVRLLGSRHEQKIDGSMERGCNAYGRMTNSKASPIGLSYGQFGRLQRI